MKDQKILRLLQNISDKSLIDLFWQKLEEKKKEKKEKVLISGFDISHTPHTVLSDAALLMFEVRINQKRKQKSR